MLFFLCLLLTSISLAQNYHVDGIIYDENAQLLSDVNILVEENRHGTASNLEGQFFLQLPAGKFTLNISHVGYQSQKVKIEIPFQLQTKLKIYLKKSVIRIGGITIRQQHDLIPLELSTQSRILSEEIEHLQASNLNEVLKLVPGAKSENPNLDTPQRAKIRDGEELGTLVILDQTPLKNNANLQKGIGYSSTNVGYDLRAIPAENIEKVEVIRGVPSAKYGNFADGVVVVETRLRFQPLRIKFKYNPSLYELNLSKSMQYKHWNVATFINSALSQRDIRIQGDGYFRFSGQLKINYRTKKVNSTQNLFFSRSIDDYKEKINSVDRVAWYNKDFLLRFTHYLKWNFRQNLLVESKLLFSYTHQDSYKQTMVSRDNTVISDRLNSGTEEGLIVFGNYLGKKWIKGEIWNLNYDFSVEKKINFENFFHTLTGGIQTSIDINQGQGEIFDSYYPPASEINSSRPRTFDQIPDFTELSFYFEDQLTGRLFKPFKLSIGARYECYRPYSFSLNKMIQSYQGSFLNPRVSFGYSIFPKTQIRLGWGRSSKAPPLEMIFPNDLYLDVIDTVAVNNSQVAEENFSIITTHRINQENTHLKAYTQTKFEMSIDQRFDQFGLTLTSFYKKSDGLFRVLAYPLWIVTHSYPHWPDQSGQIPKDTIMMHEYKKRANDGIKETYGFEFSLKSKRIKKIHSKISINGAYWFSKKSA